MKNGHERIQSICYAKYEIEKVSAVGIRCYSSRCAIAFMHARELTKEMARKIIFNFVLFLLFYSTN